MEEARGRAITIYQAARFCTQNLPYTYRNELYECLHEFSNGIPQGTVPCKSYCVRDCQIHCMHAVGAVPDAETVATAPLFDGRSALSKD